MSAISLPKRYNVMKFAVLEFIPNKDGTEYPYLSCIDQGVRYDTAKEAEDFRSLRLKNDPMIIPQNLQVICFTEGAFI